jgi:hypothetical protein
MTTSVRFVTVPGALNTEEAARAARGDHDLIFVTPQGNVVISDLSRNTPCMGWSEVEGFAALDYGSGAAILTSVATLDRDVHILIYEEYAVGITALNRIWGCLLTAGFAAPPPGSGIGALLKAVADAAKNVKNKELLRISAADMYRAEPMAAGDEVQINPADSASERAIARLRLHATFGDFIPQDNSAITMASLELAGVRRMLAAHRAPGQPYALMWQAIVREIERRGEIDLATATDSQELAFAVGAALQQAHWPLWLRAHDHRPAARRAELAGALAAGGLPPPALFRARLPSILSAGEFPNLGLALAGVGAPAECASLVLELAALADVADAGVEERTLRAVDRALEGKVPDGASARARVDLFAREKQERSLAEEGLSKEGKEGAGGTGAYKRTQSDQLHAIYRSPSFIGVASAIANTSDACACLHLALTSRFLSERIGAPDGPETAEQLAESLTWEVIPILHQIVWGKVKEIPGRDQLRKLAAMEDYMPDLLGRLAVDGLRGVDAAGKERMAHLRLPRLYEQLKKTSWEGLDLHNELLVPVLAAFHAEPPSDRVPPSDLYSDIFQLWCLARPMSKVFRVFGIPAQGADSVASWLQAAIDVVQLHMPCCTKEQSAAIRAATRAYVTTSLSQCVKTLNRCRYDADAHAQLDCKLTGETQLAVLHALLRSLNVTAAHKRSGATHLDRNGVKVPRLTGPGIGAGTKLQWGDESSRDVLDANGWKYNLRGVRERQKELGVPGCVHAWCLSGIKAPATRRALQSKHCPTPGAPGHEEDGAMHTPPKDFRPQNFILSSPHSPK